MSPGLSFPRWAAAILAVVLAAVPASAQTTATLRAARDSTIYFVVGGEPTANGQGAYVFAGENQANEPRRTLVQFDLSSIPAGSTITSAAFTMRLSRTRAGAKTLFLHRLSQSWGEGASNASANEGQGAPPQPGDATWVHRSFDADPWTTPGGDFDPAASASTTVGSTTGPYTWSSPGLVADVQMWVDMPAMNFGWLVKTTEGDAPSAKRFDSRHTASEANRPTLVVTYTAPVIPTGACCLAGGGCATATQAQCQAQGGTYRGDGVPCAANLCVVPTGACCLPTGGCSALSSAQCAAQGGVYRGDGSMCGMTPCPLNLTPFVDPLPIPAVMPAAAGQPGGAAHYEIAIREFTQQLHRDLPPTRVWGYNGTYPGRTIEARRGLPVTVRWTNDLRGPDGQLRTTHVLPVDTCLHGPDMNGAVPFTVTHLHGGHVPADSDGHPDDAFAPGMSSSLYTYPNDQRAAMNWYHDHALGITRLNVYMGLAGVYYVRDPVEDALNLPRGEFEIPLVIQDRSFNPDGSLRYLDAWHEHFFGDVVLVNGKVWPFLNVKQGKYRFRVLNGSNSRAYTLSLSSGAAFFQIGSDGGLLTAPVGLTSVTLTPGERADLVVDFAGHAPGTAITLLNSATAPFPGGEPGSVVPNVMRFFVGSAPGDTDALPAVLSPVARVPASEATVTRTLELRREAMGHCPGHEGGPWTIDGRGWDEITEFPRLGATEIWSFVNRSGVTHPMHLHLLSFQVLDRQDFSIVGGVVTPVGPRLTPPAAERGWKDTVQATPFQITRVIARFAPFAGTFAYHCHILEHEDHEMMRQFRVLGCNDADIVGIGGFPPPDGEITVDDYTSFINAFAADELLADTVSIGGFPPPDGMITVDDYTSFINSFASGCE